MVRWKCLIRAIRGFRRVVLRPQTKMVSRIHERTNALCSERVPATVAGTRKVWYASRNRQQYLSITVTP